jgi:hypothetical protein
LVVQGITTVSPGSNNTGAASLTAIPPLWLNELQAFNNAGITDNFGEREPWIELYNAGPSAVDLSSLYLADNYDTNLTRWQFPAGATIAPGEFKVIWADGEPGESSALVRERVLAARTVQQQRYSPGGARTNADLRGSAVGTICRPDADGRRLLTRAAARMGLTARGYDRVLKVARTVADLAGAVTVDADHVAEALQYRLVE